MIRNNVYVMYDGKEYELGGRGSKNNLFIRSYSREDTNNGWELIESKNLRVNGSYIKRVSKKDLINPHKITTWALYKGREFSVRYVKDDECMLDGSYNDKDLGFTQTGWGEYTKTVKTSEIEKFFEKKEPIELP